MTLFEGVVGPISVSLPQFFDFFSPEVTIVFVTLLCRRGKKSFVYAELIAEIHIAKCWLTKAYTFI